MVEDVESSQACQDLCVEHADCLFFSYFSATGDCSLKADDGGRIVQGEVISGPVICVRKIFYFIMLKFLQLWTNSP